ncbi:MAG: pre-peptidase C-terminal domain-containing protein [Acidobacteria bacterium]|nr:pre-peptidase C-terminal domain-containing protein [Acidobacteriota bacterium]
MTLPMPDGKFQRFRIEESPIMDAELAAQFPDTKTYQGYGIDVPTATMRFDWTPAGFHAMVLSGEGTVYVDPYAKGDADHYITYYKRDARREAEPFRCLVSKTNANLTSDEREMREAQLAANSVTGDTLRVYRLVVATTVEYTNFHGGTVASAMNNGVVPTINRVNAIYRRDLSIHFTLIGDTSNVIYTGDPGKDPYTNGNADKMAIENQNNLSYIVGIGDKFDIGHVFGTTGSGLTGVAYIGVCVANSHARGASCSSNPIGTFDVDEVAHEMGHQFGADHTFNGTAGSCGDGNRVGSTAFEPGSGSTIMAYAGICGSQDVQSNSDDYFHAKSIAQINSWPSCPFSQLPTGNHPPSVSAGADVVIPRLTPFTLNAVGSDPDGDVLSYCWEEYDKGPASGPDAGNAPDNDVDGKARPLFRSRPPVMEFPPAYPGSLPNTSRTFPRMADLLNGYFPWEALPTIDRTMKFRVTVRDNKTWGGGVNSDDVNVKVDAGSGPFKVVAPASGEVWTAGTPVTITWDVANTGAGSTVNCTRVNILLSTDGGFTFQLLKGSVANDGAETIWLDPNLIQSTTNNNRIKVEAAGNIFFDISDRFTILPWNCSSSAFPITIGDTLTGALSSNDCRSPIKGASFYADRYRFSASAGQKVVVSLKSSSFDTFLYLIGPNGAVIAQDDDSGDGTNSLIPGAGFLALPESGSYVIEVTSYAANAVGAYSLSLSTDCSSGFSITPTSMGFSGAGGTASVTVTGPAGCNWTANTSANWIRVGSGGRGKGVLTYTVSAFPSVTSSVRTATIGIAGRTHTVTQNSCNPLHCSP